MNAPSWYRRLTAEGLAGVHVFGLGGPALEMLERVHLVDRRGGKQGLEWARLVDGDEIVDEILYRRLSDSGEISVHGGMAVEARTRRLLEKLGFDERAELPSPRGIAGLARQALERARSRRQVVFFARLAEGALDLRIREIAAGLLGAETGEQVARLREDIQTLLDRAPFAAAMSRPPTVCIRGPANAGKSSLFNKLVGADRVIVSDRPGTTRDAVEGWAEIEGFPFRLIDLAGDRATEDAVELLGQDEGRRRAASADVVLDLRPAAERDPHELPAADHRLIPVASRIDEVDEEGLRRWTGSATGVLMLSLVDDTGLEKLRRRIVARSAFGLPGGEEMPGPFDPIQVATLREAQRQALTAPNLAAARLLEICDLESF